MITRRATLGLVLAAPALVLLPRSAAASEPQVYQTGGIAIDGSDAVAFFERNGPVAGSPDLALDWNGATWRFATEANRAAFAADPARFAPAFGGYCAFAVANNYTAATDPEAWSIVEDRLYLNFNRRIRRRWLRDVPGHIAAGNANWPGVLG